MGIVDIVRQGLQIARTHKSLWLFAFVVGLSGSPGGNEAGRGGGAGGVAGAGAFGVGPRLPLVVLIVAAVLALVAVFIVIKLVSEGALIEGVKRARRHESLSVREGIRVGWENSGVLFRVAALYAAATVGSGILIGAPCVIAVRLIGSAAFVPAIVAILIFAVPWFVTLYMLQAFASRIAVLENRRALDAIRRARLFLHGRMRHALKLMVAAFVGTLFVAAVGVAVIVPWVLLLAAAAKLLGVAIPAAIGVLTLVPAIFVLLAFMGTVQSSAWTIGYLAQTEGRS